MKQNRTWLNTINTILVLLFILFLISILLTLKDAFPLSIELAKSGLDTLITMFNTSIKIGAALIAIITIKVYFSNINQTDKIIERTDLQVSSYIKSENLKNYFLHRKEFRLYFQELNFFKDSFVNQTSSFYSLWDTLYRAFYYSSYKDFEPKLEVNAKISILSFLNSIKKSSTNTMVVPAFEEAELNKLVSFIIPSIEEIIERFAIIQFKEFNQNIEGGSITDEKIRIAHLLIRILITKQLYESILCFDGENIVKLDVFNNNVSDFFNLIKTNNHGK